MRDDVNHELAVEAEKNSVGEPFDKHRCSGT